MTAAPHIEMNLACGVLDLKDSSAAAAAQQATNAGNCAAALDQAPVLRDMALPAAVTRFWVVAFLTCPEAQRTQRAR